MNQKKYIAMGVGVFALFLVICGGAFYMGTQNDMSQDTMGTVFVEAVDGLYHSLEEVDTSSKELRLQEYSGAVSLRLYNETKTVVTGMRLENQDRLATALASSAYLTMDQTRVMRLNEESEVTVTQGGEDLSFHLAEGTVFFNVTEPLLPTETLEFSTNNVVTGVRGTSGIITFSFNEQGQAVSQIALLTGVLDCYAIDSTTTERPQFSLEAGQVAIVTSLEDGTVDIEILELEPENLLFFLPDDFIDTIQGDLNHEGNSVPLSEYLRGPSGDLLLYQELLDWYREGYYIDDFQQEIKADSSMDLSYAYELVDFYQDGYEELLIYKNGNIQIAYGNDKEKAVFLGESGYRWYVHVLSNGVIVTGGSSGAERHDTALAQWVDGQGVHLASMNRSPENYEETGEYDIYTPDKATYDYYAEADVYEPQNLVLLYGTPWW